MAAGNRESIVRQINAAAERVAAAEGLELVEADMLGGGGARLVRIYIDKPGGVSHADCEKVSHEVGAILDAEDIIPGGGYQLEVSSPGVERPLRKPSEYERFLGQKAKIVLREPVANRRRWEGKLAGFSGGVVTLEPAAGEAIQFTLEQVEKANLKFEW